MDDEVGVFLEVVSMIQFEFKSVLADKRSNRESFDRASYGLHAINTFVNELFQGEYYVTIDTVENILMSHIDSLKEFRTGSYSNNGLPWYEYALQTLNYLYMRTVYNNYKMVGFSFTPPF